MVYLALITQLEETISNKSHIIKEKYEITTNVIKTKKKKTM